MIFWKGAVCDWQELINFGGNRTLR